MTIEICEIILEKMFFKSMCTCFLYLPPSKFDSRCSKNFVLTPYFMVCDPTNFHIRIKDSFNCKNFANLCYRQNLKVHE